MFDIEYKGGNGIVLATKKTTVVIDPNLSVIGLKNIKIKNAVELATEARFALNDVEAPLVIEGPGDYEIGDFSIHGVRALRHIDSEADEPISTMYRIEVGDARIAVIGNIGLKLNEEQQEELGIVDILLIPVGGGGYTLDATSAATIVRQIDPKVVVPVHYADSEVQYEVPQDTLDVFLKELAAPIEDVGTKYKVKSLSSIPQVLTVVKLDRS